METQITQKNAGFLSLPDQLLAKIFGYVYNPKSIGTLLRVSRRFLSICMQSITRLDVSYCARTSPVNVIRMAVRFSFLRELHIMSIETKLLAAVLLGCPLLISLHMEGIWGFVTDESLELIATHLPNIRSLILHCGSLIQRPDDIRPTMNTVGFYSKCYVVLISVIELVLLCCC